MGLTVAEIKELQSINYGIADDYESLENQKTFIIKPICEKNFNLIPNRVTRDTRFLKHTTAAMIYFYVMSMPANFEFNPKKYAELSGIRYQVISKNVTLLCDWGYCRRRKHNNGTMNYFFYRYPTKEIEESPLQHAVNTPDTLTTYQASFILKKDINNKQHTNISNKLSANSVPNKPVVSNNSKKVEEKKEKPIIGNPTNIPIKIVANVKAIGNPTQQPIKITKEAQEKVNSVLKNINPDDRTKINKSLLFAFHESFSVAGLSDRCIHAVEKWDKVKADSPNAILRRYLENPHWHIPRKNYYLDYDIAPGGLLSNVSRETFLMDYDIAPGRLTNWSFDKSEFERHNERLHLIAEKNRREKNEHSEIYNDRTSKHISLPVKKINENTANLGVSVNIEKNIYNKNENRFTQSSHQPEKIDSNETLRYMNEIKLSDRLRNKKKNPIVNQKYRNTKGYWERKNRPDLKGFSDESKNKSYSRGLFRRNGED